MVKPQVNGQVLDLELTFPAQIMTHRVKDFLYTRSNNVMNQLVWEWSHLGAVTDNRP